MTSFWRINIFIVLLHRSFPANGSQEDGNTAERRALTRTAGCYRFQMVSCLFKDGESAAGNADGSQGRLPGMFAGGLRFKRIERP